MTSAFAFASIMGDLQSSIGGLLSPERLATGLRAVLLAVAGVAVARLASRGVVRMLGSYLDAQGAMVLRRAIFVPLVALVVILFLRELGFDLSVVLGAAGILTVAIGFASQTAASNVISGLFLLAEQPFRVGDWIRIGERVGEVLSIDVMSVKLRTPDNTFVRVPNEAVLKSETQAITRFPIRRLDILFGLRIGEDLQRVKAILADISEQNPRCCEEPATQILFTDFGESSVRLRFSVWVERNVFLDVQSELIETINRRLTDEGVEIAVPYRRLLPGAPVSDGFPVAVTATPPAPAPTSPPAAAP